jgi:excisionase family DNA binding protein
MVRYTRPPATRLPEQRRSLKSVPTGPAIALLTVVEAAQLLKISVTSVRRLQERRVLAFIKVGGRVRFAQDDILAYLERRRVEPVGQ